MENILSKIKTKNIYYNLSVARLIEESLTKKSGILTDTGAILIKTGKYTGRSPKDKYIVDTKKVHDNIAWGNVNRPISKEKFEIVKKEMIKYLTNKDVYVFDGFAGAEKKHQRKIRIINEKPEQNLFIHQLLIRPTQYELDNYNTPDWTVLVAPGYKCNFKKLGLNSEAVISIDYENKEAIICGSAYCGEIKKTVFSIMNYVLPIEDNVLPMHCSCNMDEDTKETAVFFGLSGTGKTTLSADPDRKLIGDDEHGWSENGVFNIEGGCYAKCINLSRENEPEIYDAIKYGSILENVGIDIKTRKPDYNDGSITENTRTAYPINYIPNSELTGCGSIPKVVIFLTADAFGVLPPISRLDRNAAMYHFVTGFTSKLAGTERGVTEPEPTFSTLFGEPFMPLSAGKYAKMLGERLDKYNTKVYLINTGWSGGQYGVGSRIKLKYTRAMVTAALTGEIENANFTHNDLFNLDIPDRVTGAPYEILNPRDVWKDKNAYDVQAKKLATMFKENFEKKYKDIDKEIRDAGPRV